MQGDVVSGGKAAVFGHAANPISHGVRQAAAAGDGVVLAQMALDRFVVLTQTCDLVRPAQDRPFVQIAAVVDSADPSSLKGDRPRFVPLPWAGDQACADLDTIAVLEKPLYERIVAAQTATPARPTHDQARRFAYGIGRFFNRFAFPDDVTHAVRPLGQLFKDKHNRATSPVQAALQAVTQIRASPAGGDWDAAVLDVMLHFIVAEDTLSPPDPDEARPDSDLVAWADDTARTDVQLVKRLDEISEPADCHVLWAALTRTWAARCQPGGHVVSISAEVSSEAGFPLNETWRSERVDLDHLSTTSDLGTTEL